ncbi:FtsK/SpoIIIE domain-containing protein [Xylanimonas oleitrophica]|nr:FtsK/SpoIIIE domain-containing protein [Xylanimonas oleitrophica]
MHELLIGDAYAAGSRETGGVRVTVHPGEDVLLPAGSTVADVRGPLADLLRRPELRHAPLTADGVPLAPGSVVGERPLLPGATLAVGPSRPAAASRWSDDAAPGAPWMVARVAGLDAGELAGLAPGVPLPVPGGLEVRLSARGAVTVRRSTPRVRTARWRPAGPPPPDPRAGTSWPGLLVRAQHATVRPRLSRRTPWGRERRRTVGRAWRRWRPEEVLHDGGGAAYALRRSGDLGALLAPAPGARHASTGSGTPGVATMLATALLPVLGSVGLAVALRQPVFALFALVGLLAVAPQLVAAVRRRAAARAGAGGVGAHGDRPTPGSPTAGADGAVADSTTARGGGPARVAWTVLAAHQAPAGTWRRALAARAPGPFAGAAAVTGLSGGPGAGGLSDSATDAGATDDSAVNDLLGDGLLADGALAVRGPERAAAAVARAVVAGLAVGGAAVRVRGQRRDTWAWCRWLPDRRPHGDRTAGGPTSDGPAGARPAGATAPGRLVLVVDDGDAVDLHAAHEAHRAGGTVVLLLPAGVPVPPWCRAVLDVADDAPGIGTGTSTGTSTSSGSRAAGAGVPHVRRSTPGGSTSHEALVGVSVAWAERLARRLAGLHGLGRDVALLLGPAPHPALAAQRAPEGADPADPRLPAMVPLAGLLQSGQAAGRWAVPLGVDARGRTVSFDLVEDGPHLLVAGTTGAGKSELLQSLVLGLALSVPPRDLALALVDFKGGASFGACAGLPHVVGQVTDLDVALASRALDGLRAELRRREHVLAAHGASDLAALPAGTLPRLVVVVDEFRALADDLPELLPGLLRVAAQGRSLGVHLVLATQRPAGAVGPDVRANVSARIALRVVDAADSHDVLDSAVAAHVPVGVPGRAVLRVGASAPVALQCAHAGTPAATGGPGVRRAPAWAEVAGATPREPGPGGGAGGGGAGAGGAVGGVQHDAAARPEGVRREADTGPGHPDDQDVVAALVAQARADAEAAGHAPWPAPWLPPLPDVVTDAELGDLAPAPRADGLAPAPPHPAPAPAPAREGALPLALGDLPAEQARTLVAWHPADGHLAVLGRARSGRTTTLRRLAHAALARGWHVHVLAPPPALESFEPLRGHPGLGTLAGPHDPRRATRLLRLLQHPGAAGAGRPPVLVLVDGVEDLRGALATPTHDPLAAALGAGTVTFALSADTAAVGGLASRVGPRLVLLSPDAHGDVMLGAPSALAGRGRVPGRAAWAGQGDPVECQVAMPGSPAPRARTEAHAAPAVTAVPALAATAHAGGTSAAAVPGDETAAGGSGAAPARVLPLPRHVDAGELPAHDAEGRPVVGVGGDAAAPVALGVGAGALVAGPRGSGRTTTLRLLLHRLPAVAAVVARDRALLAEATEAGATAIPPTPDGLRQLLALLEEGWRDSGEPPLVLVDDADVVSQACPLECERLGELAAAGTVAVVAASTTLSAGIAHRGLLAHLRSTRTGIVLAPAERGSDEVLGTPLDDATEVGVQLPGRGALVGDGVAQAVQVALQRARVSPRSSLPPRVA